MLKSTCYARKDKVRNSKVFQTSITWLKLFIFISCLNYIFLREKSFHSSELSHFENFSRKKKRTRILTVAMRLDEKERPNPQ